MPVLARSPPRVAAATVPAVIDEHVAESDADIAEGPGGLLRPDIDPRGEPPESEAADAGPRAEARARARRLLGEAPWASATERITLWLVSPPRDIEAQAGSPVDVWLAIDRPAAQTLGGEGQRLSMEGAIGRELGPPAASGPGGRAALFTVEALESLLAGDGRRALEARWSLCHAEPLADRLGRHERYVGEASRTAGGAFERALRGAYLSAAAALPVLGEFGAGAPRPEGLPAAGEAVAALARLACLLDGGNHPPLAWLIPAARETGLGRRIASWLDDLARSLAGDEAAARRVAAARAAVLEQARVLVAHRIGTRPWLRDPASFALHPGRS